MRSWVRTGVISILNGFLSHTYAQPELWAHPWLAGSGVSYQWQAARQPGDLDCLIGVDFIQFRKANPRYAGLSDKEIADQLNEDFGTLEEQTADWNGYELTFYVNPAASDIRTIKPYAAYDLKYDEWTVTPDPQAAPPTNPEWDSRVSSDATSAHQISTRFNAALQDVRVSQNDALRRNAENRMTIAAAQGNALYNEIHSNRSLAFSPTGQGYADFNNYRWQAGKKSGTIQALRNIRQYMKDSLQATNAQKYGVDLPDSDTLIRRAATYRNQ